MAFKHRIWPNILRHKETLIWELVVDRQQTSVGCHKIYLMNLQNIRRKKKRTKKNSDNLASLAKLDNRD